MMLLSIGIFTIILGFLPSKRHYRRDEFEQIRGTLTEDASNRGPRYRTFSIDSMPKITFYLEDVHLDGSTGPTFSKLMRAGAKVIVEVPKDELEAIRQGGKAHLHPYGLIVDETTLLDIDAVVADQPAYARRKQIAYYFVGGVLLIGGLIFGAAKLKARPKPPIARA